MSADESLTLEERVNNLESQTFRIRNKINQVFDGGRKVKELEREIFKFDFILKKLENKWSELYSAQQTILEGNKFIEKELDKTVPQLRKEYEEREKYDVLARKVSFQDKIIGELQEKILLLKGE